MVRGFCDSFDDDPPGSQCAAVKGHSHDPVVLACGEVDEDGPVRGEGGGRRDPQKSALSIGLDPWNMTDRYRSRALGDVQHLTPVTKRDECGAIRQEGQPPRHRKAGRDGLRCLWRC